MSSVIGNSDSYPDPERAHEETMRNMRLNPTLRRPQIILVGQNGVEFSIVVPLAPLHQFKKKF